MKRAAALIAGAFLLSSCLSAPRSRGLDELRHSTFAQFSAPHGTALVSEEFRPMHYSLGAQGHICAELRRTFAANDPDAFLAAVRDAATQATSRGTRFGSTARLMSPVINDGPGYIAGGDVYGASEDLEVTVVFFDLDSESRRGFDRSIDVRSWRFAVWIRVHDDCMGFAGRFQ